MIGGVILGMLGNPLSSTPSLSILCCEMRTSSQLGGLAERIIFSEKIYYYVLNSIARA